MNNALWLLLVVALCPRTAEGGTCHVSDSAATFVADDSIVPRHTIFVGGDLRNPRIVLFHELPGLSPHDLALGARLACEGFRVYMPLMFGQKGDKNWGQKQVCNPIDGVRLFWCNDGGREHPILSQWVRDAVARIGKDGAPLAVMGMSQ
jgi:dienelactone hydrolase